MDFDLADLAGTALKTIAPLIGTALGGPVGGAAAGYAVKALFGDDKTKTPKDAAELIKSGNLSPEQMSALKQADMDFKKHLADNNLKLEEVAAQDRDSARKMQVSTRSNMPALVAMLALAGFFGILSALIFVELPTGAQAPLNIMLGVLGTLVVGVSNFYFGSSAGSKAKTELMAK